ncbi:MAG: hypothetical protein Q8O89_08455, partial [Nanoarchaeota archaeon]|nr:hypothetical protein [Nanoarchaeota archaeon]
ADVFRGRIRRWQYWRFLVYVNSLITAGISVSKDEKYKEFVSYTPTRRILKIWQANMKYQKRKSIAEKIAEKNHCSIKRALKETVPYVQFMFKSKNNEVKTGLQAFFEFDDEEAAWLANS